MTRPGGPLARTVLLSVAASLSACTSLPHRGPVPATTAISGTADTRLGRAIEAEAARHPGLTGIYPLNEGKGALAARILLADAADRSLDVQYYIWHADASGTLLMEHLRRAAERGVRVRLLLDDNGVAGLDPMIAALDAHPNVEVRLYNPFVNRSARALGYLTDFERLNRRMHNKSFTADGEATIVGGRNIGNEYFAAGQEISFTDLDVIAVGPVVADVAGAFDRYWNSAAAYPAAAIVRVPPAQRADIAALAAAVAASREAADYRQALLTTTAVRDLVAGALPLEWASARLVCDDPAKTQDRAQGRESQLTGQVQALLGKPQRELLIVSPYFVPGPEGSADLAALVDSGVAVTVLTNSLAANDVAAVHSGYARRRIELLRRGVRLFELKPQPAAADGATGGAPGHSGASLHAKTFAVDGERIFVGSFNFDMRSAHLNTEMGLLVDSPALAARLAAQFREAVPLAAWEPVLTPAGKLTWIERVPGGEVRLGAEPRAGLLRRFAADFISLLPVEWLL